MDIPLSPCVPENLVSLDGFSRPVPRQPAHLHTQAESGAYLRDSSRVPRRRPCMEPPYATGSVPSLSGHAIAYRWCSLPRVRRHRASKPQGSFERVLPWQVTMDQLIFASISHTHYWYEVGMLKVPAWKDPRNSHVCLCPENVSCTYVYTWSFEKYKILLWLFFKKNLNESIPIVSNIQAYRLPTRKNYFTRWVNYKMYPTGTAQVLVQYW